MTALLRVDDDFVRDPFPRFDELRARGPVHVLRTRDGARYWLVVGSDEIRSGLRDTRLSKDPDLLAAARVRQRSEHGVEDGPGAEAALRELTAFMRSFTYEVREVVKDTLSGRHAARHAPRVAAIAEELLDGLAGAVGPVDLLASYSMPFATRVSGSLLGVAPDALAEFGAWVSAWLGSDSADTRAAARQRVSALLGDLVAARRRQEADDIVSALAGKAGTADRESLVRACLIFVMITVETVVSFLATAVYALLTHPEQLRLLRDRPERTGAAIDELLRFAGPHNVSAQRCATEDLELGGQHIAEGDLVVFALGAANHDATVYPDPHCLDLDRDAAAHLAFGAGRHYCPGTHHARSALATGIGALLRRYPGIALAVPADEVSWVRSELLRSVRTLPVHLAGG
ncbi:cytochrome P450 [Prauserella flavalba]|uniref:Cytochrome P450 n=1 Tax=Prauserella flavalba TaxID=1477506 RepID=A0A318LUX9_9PSEU|nr:cytochrome P450 [Prauserella flavalba]PXY38412.1 hypothetical protein BA062_01255 [Prauserella flavalba]